MKKRITFLAAAVLLLALVLWTIWGNSALQVNSFSAESELLPPAFDGFRIAQISDLHNTSFGDGNSKLLSLLRESSPDIIVITGDLIDSRNTDVEIALNFVRAAVEIAPVYYVTGNHEFRVPSDFALLEAGMTEAGVCILREDAVLLERNDQKICLAGIDDLCYYGTEEAFTKALSSLCDRDEYLILLSHRPVLAESYAKAGAELTLCGHVHGGQFRLPILGGLIGPDQGLFPKYDSGVYEIRDSTMIVSRGLGNSLFPFRFNNRPEIVLVELHIPEA